MPQVALLPSSTTYGMLVPYEAQADPFAVEDPAYAAETRQTARADADARRAFETETGKAPKAKRAPAKPKAKKKELASSDDEDDD